VSEERSALGLHWFRKTARYSCGVPEEDKEETSDALMRSIEIELAEKRTRWQRDREKYRLVRLLAFSFLSLVIIAGLVVLFLIFSRAGELRHPRATPTPNSFPVHD
jgi:hypothetical protein